MIIQYKRSQTAQNTKIYNENEKNLFRSFFKLFSRQSRKMSKKMAKRYRF